MNRRLVASSFGIALVATLAACAAPAADDVIEEARLTADPLAATANTAVVSTETKTETVGRCTVEYDALSLQVADAAVTAALASAVAIDVPALLQAFEADCDNQAFTLTVKQPVTFNAHGVLAIERSYSWYYDGAAHPDSEVSPLNFELGHGTPIDLVASVDAAGRAILEEACTRYLDDAGLQGSSFCPAAVNGDEYGPPSFAVEAEGLRIHPVGLPHAAGELMWEGTLTPWSLLASHLTSDALRAVAQP